VLRHNLSFLPVVIRSYQRLADVIAPCLESKLSELSVEMVFRQPSSRKGAALVVALIGLPDRPERRPGIKKARQALRCRATLDD
jgi:hypothetical protein